MCMASFTTQVAGKLAQFCFSSMLLNLTTSVVLVGCATTVVNILATYALSYSPFYRRAIYQATDDFSDLRAANRLPDEEVNAELLKRSLPTHGTRVDRICRLLEGGWLPPTPAGSLV